MTVPPPHPNPYLPPGHPYGPPRPPRMPGLTTTAVVLLWVMVAISTFSALLALPLFASGSPVLDLLPADATLLMSIGAVQGVAWAGLRGYIAVQIIHRSSAARSAAFVVEGVGMAFQVVLAVLLFNTVAPAGRPEGMSFHYNFDCTGLVLPILVICFLSTARSRWWCDR